MILRRLFVLLVLSMLFGPMPNARANADAAAMALCRNAAIAAADRNGVPREVMLAISLVETRTKRGGVSGPWPWTVNVAGKGFWFDSRAAALLHAQRALQRGQRSFDVGCFQLNFRWHGSHFASIDQMFEPKPSGDYAARFVKDLFRETGDWIKASGLYHSRTAKHSKRYRTLVAKTVKAMGGKVPQPTAVADAEKGVSKAPVRHKIYRRSGDGLLYPLPAVSANRVAGNARSAGSVGTVVLRRSNGGLLRVAPRKKR